VCIKFSAITLRALRFIPLASGWCENARFTLREWWLSGIAKWNCASWSWEMSSRTSCILERSNDRYQNEMQVWNWGRAAFCCAVIYSCVLCACKFCNWAHLRVWMCSCWNLFFSFALAMRWIVFLGKFRWEFDYFIHLSLTRYLIDEPSQLYRDSISNVSTYIMELNVLYSIFSSLIF